MLSFLLTYSIYAQEASQETSAIYKKGRIMLGVSNLSFGHSKTIRDGSGNAVSGNLRLGGNLRTGLFVKDRWMLGVELGYIFNANRAQDVNYNVFNISAFSRHYMPISKKLSFFTEVNAGYNRTFYTNQSSTWGQQGNVFLGAEAGLAYQMGKRISLEASMGYYFNFNSNAINLYRTGLKLGLNFHF